MQKKVKKKIKREWSRKKIIISSIFFLLILLIFFGTNFYLYVKYLLGNDVLVRFSVDKENLFLTHGQKENVEMTASVYGNLFCNIKCKYYLEDLSMGVISDETNFSTSLFNREYSFSSPPEGVGQKLYRATIKCSGEKTSALCHTREKNTTNSILITLNYDLSEEEKQKKESLRKKFYELQNSTNSFYLEKENLTQKINLTNGIFRTNVEISYSENFSEYLYNASLIWNSGDLKNFEFYLNKTNYSLENEINYLINASVSLEEQINSYESIRENISITEKELNEYSSQNFTENTSKILDESILNFNDLKESIISSDSLVYIKSNYSNFYDNYNTKKIIIVEETNSSVEKLFLPSAKVNNFSMKKIQTEINLSLVELNFTLVDTKPVCCFKGNCSYCYTREDNYPVLFLHGHGFSASVSPEYILNSFDELQEGLENDSYINAGSFILSPLDDSLEGILGQNNNALSIKSSYYFDSIADKNNFNVLETKTDNIDTYAVRLKDIIENVKFITGKEKVVIVTHSMGGLVLRRYMQIFGEESLAQVTLITAPNKGIDNTIFSLCKFFGEQKECEDMSENSLLIGKLNLQKKPNVEFNNIIGIGCDMGNNNNGDGIVQNRSAYLEWANNYYVNGSCNGVEYLHNTVLSPEKHPEVYELLRKILKNETVI